MKDLRDLACLAKDILTSSCMVNLIRWWKIAIAKSAILATDIGNSRRMEYNLSCVNIITKI